MLELTTEQNNWLQKNNISVDEWKTLQNSLFPGAKAQSIILYLNYCRARKLDPMKKPAHIVPMNVKDSQTGQYSWRDVIMPGIYEYRTTAMRTGKYAGQDDVVYGDDIEIEMGLTKKKAHTVPSFAKVTVYRLLEGVKCAFTGTAYFTETCATTKDGNLNSMWDKRPRGQLAKCAEADALRKAFPDELGGEMTVEEMEGKTIDSDDMPSVSIVSEQQHEKYLSLIDGHSPLDYYIFMRGLEPEEMMEIAKKYNSQIPRGKKGKETERLNELFNKGLDMTKEYVEMFEKNIGIEDALSELTAPQLEYISSELSPQGKRHLDDIKEVA